jgi:hypothetical protein
MVKSVTVYERVWVMFGATLKSFAIGFNISKYGGEISLGFIWVAVEW